MTKFGYAGLAVLAVLGVGAALYFTPRPHDSEKALPGTEFGWPARTVPLDGARFSDPFGVALDKQGNLYVADDNRILKRSSEGIVTIFAEGFDTPSGLAIDETGTLFVADTGNNAIRKITPQGQVTTLAAGQAHFNGPIGLAVDKAGTVFVADTYNDRILAISPTGQVTTLAGGFDTPCALLVDLHGNLIVADTRNDALKIIDKTGQVSTLSPALPPDSAALFGRPVSLAMTPDGFLYVGTMAHGRIFQISPDYAEMRGLTGLDIDIPRGDNDALRLVQPNGLAVAADGSLFAADSPAHGLRKIVRRSDGDPIAQRPAPDDTRLETVSWPVNPRLGFHEVVGTMGEVRGNDQGDSRDHFHAGLDVQANMGTPIYAITSGKIRDPLPAWGYDSLGEGLSIDAMSYIHMRVGRMADGTPIDPKRFVMAEDATGRKMVRVKRGTRFAAGDMLGTVNRMYHVHLEFSPDGGNRNPLDLPFPGLTDHIAPHIETIQLVDKDGKVLTAKQGGHLLVPASAGDIGIVVGAYDQIDGDAARRRTGLYKAGYQILTASGQPVPGFEQPLITIEFNRLPPDRQTVKIAFAEGSGETVHGSATTRFLYAVTNTVRDGRAETGSWHAAALPRGDYVIRIFAADYAGNVATVGRDLPVTLN